MAVTIDLHDKNLGENMKAIQEMKNFGFDDAYIQELYDKQFKKDNGCERASCGSTMNQIKACKNLEFDLIYDDGTTRRVHEGILFEACEDNTTQLHLGTSRLSVYIAYLEAAREFADNLGFINNSPEAMNLDKAYKILDTWNSDITYFLDPEVSKAFDFVMHYLNLLRFQV